MRSDAEGAGLHNLTVPWEIPALLDANSRHLWWRTAEWRKNCGVDDVICPPACPAAPVVLKVGGRSREFQDGGGLCSPGRLAPDLRPLGRLVHLAPLIHDTIAAFSLTDCLEAAAKSGTIGKLHKYPKEGFVGPFPAEAIDQIQQKLASRLHANLQAAPGQPFLLDLEAKLLEAMGDPAAALPTMLAEGGPMAVDEVVPYHADVWPACHSRQVQAHDLSPAPHNHGSCEDHIDAIRGTYAEDVIDGMALGPLTELQAQTVCESEILFHGAIGSQDEYRTLPDGSRTWDKCRTPHDGKVVGLTAAIRKNLRGRTTSPSIHEVRYAMRHSRQCPHRSLGVLIFDVSKAHRRCKLNSKDWKYATAKLAQDEIYVNLVGTYGIASAQW